MSKSDREGYEFTPGEWPNLAVPRSYQRLVALARRRMVGHELHAEDAVSRAVIRWARLSSDLQTVARLEQVVASEANSIVRSEGRRRDREERSARDPTLHPSLVTRDSEEQVVVAIVIGQSMRRSTAPFTDLELLILDLLRAGLTTAEICRRHNLSRYYVGQVRRQWRLVLRPAFNERDVG